MNLLIVVHHRFELWRAPAWFSQRLAQEFPELAIVHRDSYEGLEPNLRAAEIVFTLSLRPEQFVVCEKLRWIHTPTAAVHQFLFPELVNSDVVLTNSTEVHGPVVAEHVMALIFALAKKIPQATALQRKHEWGKESIWSKRTHPKEISGATLGLVGLGSIGRRVARMASGLGMRVLAVREHVKKEKPEGVDSVYSGSQFDDVLRQSDFVVLAAPLTPQTTKLMNAERFTVMKPDSYLINVGRGQQVDETALAEALRAQRIAGAALDVFDEEPLPADSPLWDIENLLITPHTAGITDKLWQRHYENFSGNLRRYLANQPLEHVVDKHKGY
ncbi:MAG TPA: D-2-hydroxyacid dehydrogenase [Candidatus Eisenbacteria bacterium]|nr:D-2-hydroxyacid dehydrogenase [Candidatus Eisenbacteria bacterium]